MNTKIFPRFSSGRRQDKRTGVEDTTQGRVAAMLLSRRFALRGGGASRPPPGAVGGGGKGTWSRSYVVVVNRIQFGAKEIHGFLNMWREGRPKKKKKVGAVRTKELHK